MSGIARNTGWRTSAQNDKVRLQIGNAVIEMDYSAAFDLAQGLRIAAKEAKLFAGDRSQVMKVVGSLGTQEENYERFIKPNLRNSPEDAKGVGGGH